MKPVKQKRCVMCESMYTPFKTTQRVCGVTCAKLHQRQKALTSTNLTMFEIKDNYNESHKKVSQKSKKNAVSLTKLSERAQVAINWYIRERDYNKPCPSCGSMTSAGGWDAGHWRSRASASHLKFNLLNIWKQCKYCNGPLKGNPIPYRIELIKRIGLESVEKLENDNKPRKFTREYLIRIAKIFNNRARFYEKRNEHGY